MILSRSADLDRLHLPQGLLDLLIMKTLAVEPAFGWAVAGRLRQLTNGMLTVGQGSLYPGLQRLKRSGFVEATRAKSDQNRGVKVYALTEAGKGQLIIETEAWRNLTSIIDTLLKSK